MTQLLNPTEPENLRAVVGILWPARLERYMPPNQTDHTSAIRVYLWNCAICENFYLIMHFAEIACRNSLHGALVVRAGERWYADKVFLRILSERFRSDLEFTVRSEANKHGTGLTADHIVSELSFGFWGHLATKRFDRYIWSAGVRGVFPGAPGHVTREDVFKTIEAVRKWRNRIAHHQAVYDQSPHKKHEEVLKLISWICRDTSVWVSVNSRVKTVLALRPS